MLERFLKKALSCLCLLAMSMSFGACGDKKPNMAAKPVTPAKAAAASAPAPAKRAGVPTKTAEVKRLDAVPDLSGRKILIAYFTRAENSDMKSATSVDVDARTSASLKTPGNVGRMARIIRKKVGGDLFSIMVKDPYPADYNAVLDRANEEEKKELRPEIVNAPENLDPYDVIFIGYPNWCYSIPMACLTFVEKYDFTGKIVIPFVSHGTGGLAASSRTLERSIPGATVVKPISIERDEIGQAEARISQWLEQR